MTFELEMLEMDWLVSTDGVPRTSSETFIGFNEPGSLGNELVVAEMGMFSRSNGGRGASGGMGILTIGGDMMCLKDAEKYPGSVAVSETSARLKP